VQEPVGAGLRAIRSEGHPREAWRRLLHPVEPLSRDLPLPLTGAMLAIWLGRPDLQALYPLDSAQSRWSFVLWCLQSGWREYRILEDDRALLGALDRPAADLPDDEGPFLSELMRQVHRARRDLQAAFDPSTAEGRLGLLGWFIKGGWREVRGDAPMPRWQADALLAPCPRVVQDQGLPITWCMYALHSARGDLQAAFDLGEAAGRRGFLRWYFLYGIAEMRLPGMPGEAERALLARPVIGEAVGDPGRDAAIDLLGCWIWEERPDLQQRFTLTLPEHRAAYAAWLAAEGRAAFGYGPPPPPAEATPSATASARIVDGGRRPGVDLVGYAFGELGIGEDVRMAAQSCEAAGIPFGVIDVDAGAHRQQDTSVAAHVRPGFGHSAVVLCMTGFETVRTFARLGKEAFAGRYVIGYWPWELPRWPDTWSFAFDLVDEVWVSSRYTQEAYALQAPVPVVHMPMAVTVGRRSPVPRSRFGLPTDRFLFVFSFDGFSYLARKNPLAVVQSFLIAFPLGSEPVGLVVKAMNVAGRPEWDVLCAEAARDPRIVIIADTLARDAVLGLYDACDAFVSLHRAEGFGRGLAEAMLLGKPVIATAFSGNLEFCTPQTACLVGYRRVPVAAGDYLHAEGQEWAEPDIGEAAAHMAALAADPSRARALGRAARAFVEAHHAPAVVGARYRRRLAALGLFGNGER